MNDPSLPKYILRMSCKLYKSRQKRKRNEMPQVLRNLREYMSKRRYNSFDYEMGYEWNCYKEKILLRKRVIEAQE